MNIKSILEKSLQQAMSQSYDDDKRKLKNRSKNFVEAIGESFREEFASDESVRVFTKYWKNNRKFFGLNELLFDVIVCETAETDFIRGEKLRYVKKSLWQIESEFKNDTRQAIFDFNKLVIGSGENKLFIGPRVKKPEEFIKPLKLLSSFCSGNIYIALVPHPKNWNNGDIEILFFECR